MSKKKNKVNAFALFMWDWKKEEEKKGKTFPNGLKDVQIDPKCSEAWKNLPDHKKAYYKAEQKKVKVEPEKRTGSGEKLSDIFLAQYKEQEFRDKMIEHISSEVNKAKEQNAVEQLCFYSIHINYFYGRTMENNEVEYYPAEIAIIEFSLEKGVLRVYHEIVNEEIKLGFTSCAKDHSANTHAIPLNPPFGKSDYRQIYRDICKFLEPGMKNKQLPPVYTLYTIEDVYFPIKSVLSRLAAADEKADDYIKIYSFEDLFSIMYNASIEQVGETKIEPIVAKLEIQKDPFAYKAGLECQFHGELNLNVHQCSQSYVKRWIFVLFSFCCDRLGIAMIPGIHMPKETNHEPTNVYNSYFNSSFSSMSLNESRRGGSSFSTTGVKSMTGVSSNYRQRVSERTAKEEQHRRAEADVKPLKIIDHSKLNSKIQEPIERPLRPPHTKSATAYFDTTDTESIDLSENSFPCMGRGIAMKNKKTENSTVGQGYAARLKMNL